MNNSLNIIFNNYENEKYSYNKNINIFDYMKYRICDIKDIHKYKDEKFYYTIQFPLLSNVILYENKIPLNNNIINLLQKKQNMFLLCINDQELSDIISLYKLNKLAKYHNIDANKIYIVDNNYKNDFLKKIYNLDINLHTSHILSLLVKKVNKDNNIDVKFIPIKNKQASLFLCQNNKDRIHRISLLILLKKYNILNDVDWSLITGSSIKEDDVNELLNNEQLFLKNHINTFINHQPKYNNNDNINNIKYYNNTNDIEWEKSIIKEPYENSYFNITTETSFTDNRIHITEKSFKPFAYYQFPLILSTHHHIKFMKMNYDFDFFDDIINHSYDNVVNNSDRLFKFVEEIKRIQKNKDYFIKFYEENSHRFLENYKKYMNLNNQHDIDFFNSLI